MITPDDIKQLLVSINDDLNLEDLNATTRLSDQGVESLDTFDLFLRIEEEYGVIATDEQIEDLDTFQKIADHINQEKQ